MRTIRIIIASLVVISLMSCATMRQDGTVDLERLATATWQMASLDKEQNIIGMNSAFGETATNTLLQLYGATKLAFAVIGFLKNSSMPRDIELVETIHLYYELEGKE